MTRTPTAHGTAAATMLSAGAATSSRPPLLSAATTARTSNTREHARGPRLRASATAPAHSIDVDRPVSSEAARVCTGAEDPSDPGAGPDDAPSRAGVCWDPPTVRVGVHREGHRGR